MLSETEPLYGTYVQISTFMMVCTPHISRNSITATPNFNIHFLGKCNLKLLLIFSLAVEYF